MDWFLYGIDLVHERVKTPATLLKRDSNIGVFLGNLRNFQEHILQNTFAVDASDVVLFHGVRFPRFLF